MDSIHLGHLPADGHSRAISPFYVVENILSAMQKTIKTKHQWFLFLLY